MCFYESQSQSLRVLDTLEEVGVTCSLPHTGPRAPRGGVTRQGVVLTYLLSFDIGSQ